MERMRRPVLLVVMVILTMSAAIAWGIGLAGASGTRVGFRSHLGVAPVLLRPESGPCLGATGSSITHVIVLVEENKSETIVKKAVMKIVAWLIPGAGFIDAIITMYDAILVFIDKLKKIAQVVMAFLDGSTIRAHQKAAGAAKKGDLQRSGINVKRLAAPVAASPPRPRS